MEAIKENVATIRLAHRWHRGVGTGRRLHVDHYDVDLTDLDSIKQKNVRSGMVRVMRLSRTFRVRRCQGAASSQASQGAVASQDAASSQSQGAASSQGSLFRLSLAASANDGVPGMPFPSFAMQ